MPHIYPVSVEMGVFGRKGYFHEDVRPTPDYTAHSVSASPDHYAVALSVGEGHTSDPQLAEIAHIAADAYTGSVRDKSSTLADTADVARAGIRGVHNALQLLHQDPETRSRRRLGASLVAALVDLRTGSIHIAGKGGIHMSRFVTASENLVPITTPDMDSVGSVTDYLTGEGNAADITWDNHVLNPDPTKPKKTRFLLASHSVHLGIAERFYSENDSATSMRDCYAYALNMSDSPEVAARQVVMAAAHEVGQQVVHNDDVRAIVLDITKL